MISRREMLRTAALASVAAPFVARSASAQDNWPTRDIHAICGFPPGTGADIFVRHYSRKLQEAVGRTVIVENKAGAFGAISAEYVVRSRPDGHTIFIAPGSSFLAAAPSMVKKLPFDPINDFEHVTTLSKLPFLLVVAGDSPFKSVAELVAHLKERGDKASYGSLANTGLVSSELFKAQFGLQTVEVKYRDAAAGVNDLIGKNIVFTHIDPAGAAGFIKEGRIRPLATSAAERLKALPDIPSAKEAGITNTNIIAWWSVHTPKGTPKAVLDRLETVFNKIAVDEDTRKFLALSGSDPFPGNSKMLRELLIEDTKAWAEYVRLAKIEQI